jgi:hypothetical protein
LAFRQSLWKDSRLSHEIDPIRGDLPETVVPLEELSRDITWRAFAFIWVHMWSILLDLVNSFCILGCVRTIEVEIGSHGFLSWCGPVFFVVFDNVGLQRCDFRVVRWHFSAKGLEFLEPCQCPNDGYVGASQVQYACALVPSLVPKQDYGIAKRLATETSKDWLLVAGLSQVLWRQNRRCASGYVIRLGDDELVWNFFVIIDH